MQRRLFLGAGLGAAVFAGGAGWSIFAASDEDAVVSFIRDMFPDLEMAEDELVAFADRAKARLEGAGELKKGTVNSDLLRWAADAVSDRNIHWIPSLLVADFVRSTDALDPAREGTRVHLLAFADPYEIGCANPLPTYTDANLTWP